MIKEIIRLGNKVDIQLVQELEAEKSTGKPPKIYRSIVEDIMEDGNVEMAMPIENGKVILLPLGVRFEFVYYTKGGVYRGIGVVKERYKRDNLFMMLIEMKTPLGKFQRREYYRYPCLMNMQYYVIDEEAAEKKNTEEIFREIQEQSTDHSQKQAAIVDLSGGGIRFISEDQNETGAYILVIVRLCNEKIDKQYQICGHILSSVLSEKNSNKYENRVQFVFRDSSVREEIIQYIFQEERKVRSKHKG